MMENRLLQNISLAIHGKRKLFCAFLTLGFPNLGTTEKLIPAFEQAGVDIIELGFPFSDPLADGPTIQHASEKALENGVCIEDAFNLVRRLRSKGVKIPIVFFTYFNPVYHYGLKRFPAEAVRAGFDAVLIPDLPPEEEHDFVRACRRNHLPQVYLIAPTTESKRAVKISTFSQGFIYYVSLRGVTGARTSLPPEIYTHLRHLRQTIKKPLLVGFGVSHPSQIRALTAVSDGVIVGSAIVDRIRASKGRVGPVVRYVRQMVNAVRRSSL